MTHHLDAFDDPPEVRAFEGEILVTGDLVSAAYTVRAARALIQGLQAAVFEIEGSGDAEGDGEPSTLRAVS